MENRGAVAVIGSGVSGLTAAYLLQRRYDVTLYEADDRLGGHAHTHDLVGSRGRALAIDSGFIVHNRQTYPHLIRLFAELGVATQESEMSMSIQCAGCGLEYAGGKGIRGLTAAPASLVNRRYLATLAQVPRFHRRARALLANDDEDEPEHTLGEFLAAGGFNEYFIAHFVTPLVSAVWSCGPAEVFDYPARYLFAFLAHHGMLSVTGAPRWRTVVGGSRSYVERAVKNLTAVRTATAVRTVYRRATDGVEVHGDADEPRRFSAVVIATHPDQALRLLGDATSDEREILSAFQYSRNEVTLHTDESLLPRHRRARASWNYLLPACTPGVGRVRVSYDMNRLQRLDDPTNYVVTLNGDDAVNPERVLARTRYEHPIYTPQALAAQRRLASISDRRTAFAGAYHGWGFHEDGCRSGVAAAQALGVEW